ncbi:hypothetical protein IMG5_133310 [Ichthyophthirius multifiliis]|uniref:Regulator of chromosome condensation n=1 Tax=Ichthyophthirius multifiliis TaxID=5932 RepID=G0QWL9_ICHMU|nr:hypothetical protein IMG5_133310 [Ichthyophthirius multifiliis]EGR30394.1 hypothetical protein IMG5_133310 [Ichthyophthirius multifiliis]|eukprot:XP_004031981.1 hypothetical protein IMG5_133310 [Ichthyophthirius multifiliis]
MGIQQKLQKWIIRISQFALKNFKFIKYYFCIMWQLAYSCNQFRFLSIYLHYFLQKNKIKKKLYVVGHNKYGACGLEKQDEINSFTLNTSIQDTKITQISAGDGFSLFLDDKKQISSCGFRLRHGNMENKHQFKIQRIEVLQNIPIKYINAGFSHAACIQDQTGEVFTWGNGFFYQLGHGSKQSLKTAKKIKGLNRIKNISCSRGEKYCHTICVNEDNEVFSWGSGYKGKLGHYKEWTHENQNDEKIPKKIVNFKTNGADLAVAGGIHSGILGLDKNLYTFGCGSNGRLGHKKYQNYVYLYREGIPKAIQGIKGKNCFDIASSYYYMIALCKE